jgi:hypothetical protein
MGALPLARADALSAPKRAETASRGRTVDERTQPLTLALRATHHLRVDPERHLRRRARPRASCPALARSTPPGGTRTSAGGCAASAARGTPAARARRGSRSPARRPSRVRGSARSTATSSRPSRCRIRAPLGCRPRTRAQLDQLVHERGAEHDFALPRLCLRLRAAQAPPRRGWPLFMDSAGTPQRSIPPVRPAGIRRPSSRPKWTGGRGAVVSGSRRAPVGT